MKNVYWCAVIPVLAAMGCGKDDPTFTLSAKAKIPSNTTASLWLRSGNGLLDLINPFASAMATPTTPTGSPATVQATVYGVWISKSADCSSPTKVVDNGATGSVVELTDSPVLFAGKPADGTYNCVMIEMNDILPFTPDAAAVAAWPSVCTAGTTYNPDTYATGEPAWHDINGVTVAARGTVNAPVADHQLNVFTTTPSAAIGAGTVAPITQQVQTLNGALVVPGKSTFYVDLRNSIDNTHSLCWPNPTAIGFE